MYFLFQKIIISFVFFFLKNVFSLRFLFFLCFSSFFFVDVRLPKNGYNLRMKKRRISVVDLDQLGPKIVLGGQEPFRTLPRCFFFLLIFVFLFSFTGRELNF